MSIDNLEYYSSEDVETNNDARIETGVVQIDDDWPGVFIRGDNALMGYAPALKSILDGNHEDGISMGILKDLYNLLMSAKASTSPKNIQYISRKANTAELKQRVELLEGAYCNFINGAGDAWEPVDQWRQEIWDCLKVLSDTIYGKSS